MRLDNYSVTAYEDGGPSFDDIATLDAPTAPAGGFETPDASAPVIPAEAPAAPALSELAQQATPFTPPAALPLDAAPYEPPASIASLLTPPTWQGFSVPSAAPEQPISPGPGIDAATFARIESMAGRDSSAGRGSGGGFGGFGGFGGADGGDTESWQYTYEGIDGAPDTVISVDYQGGMPVSAGSYSSLSSDAGDAISPVTPGDIGLPMPTEIGDLIGGLAEMPDLPAEAATEDAASGSPAPSSGPASPTPSPTAAGEAAAAPSAPAPSPAPAPSAAPAPAPSTAPIVGQNQDGANILAVGSYQPTGEIVPVTNAPALPADARGATPMRDDGGNGTLLYRIEGGKDDGVIRQIIPGQASTNAPSEAPDTAAGPGRRAPGAPSISDTATTSAGLALTAAQAQQLSAVNAWLASTGRAAVTTLAEAAAAVGEGLRAVEAGALLVSELAVAATAVGINLVLVAPTPDVVTALGDSQRFVTRPGERLGTLQERGADGEWRDVRTGVSLYTVGQQRVALTDEEAKALLQPLINVPAPAGPVSPPPSTPTDATLPLLHGQPITDGAAPATEGFPVLEPQTAEDFIITRNADENVKRAEARQAADPTLADPKSLAGRNGPNGVGTWVYPDQPRVDAGADYEEQCSGTPSGIDLNVGGTVVRTPNGAVTAVGGINFDGATINPATGRTVLIDAKDWSGYALPEADFWVNDVVRQAQGQLAAVAKAGVLADIEWQVSTPGTAQAIRDTLAGQQISGIRVVTVPKKGP